MIRITGILHIVKYGVTATEQEINQETMASAIDLGNYFIGHAQIAFNLMQGDPVMEKANKIIDWMKINQTPVVSARDIQQALRAHFKKMSDLWPILSMLEKHGQLILEKDEIPIISKGRKPSPRYKLHPDVYSQNTQITQKAQDICIV